MEENVIQINGGIMINADSINRNFRKIRIYSYNSLPVERKKTFHDVIIHF